jgi:hypothetical protein
MGVPFSSMFIARTRFHPDAGATVSRCGMWWVTTLIPLESG